MKTFVQFPGITFERKSRAKRSMSSSSSHKNRVEGISGRDDASAVAGADERAGVGERDEGVAAVRRRATARRDGVDDERHRVARWRRGEYLSSH